MIIMLFSLCQLSTRDLVEKYRKDPKSTCSSIPQSSYCFIVARRCCVFSGYVLTQNKIKKANTQMVRNKQLLVYFALTDICVYNVKNIRLAVTYVGIIYLH